MPQGNIPKLRLYSDIFNEKGMTDENSLSNALLTQPDVLSPVLTHLAGREDKRFPLSFLTEGMGNYHYINDIEYDYPVMGRLQKAVQAIALSGSGLNHSTVRITFPERWFNRHYIIESPQGIQFRIKNDPTEVTGGWEYACQLVTADANESVVASDVVGKQFVQLFAPGAMSGSRGTDSNWVAPSKYRNQISLVRKSYRYIGNAPNRVVNVEFDLPTGKTSLWWDFEEYQHSLRWREEKEYLLWFSRYNRDANGVIHLKDENGQPIPLGSGVMEQIPYKDTYAQLSATKLKNIVRDLLFGVSDAQQMKIVLFTGLGGLEEFDTAMKSDIASAGWIKNTPEGMAISGSGRNLVYNGGFFTSYQHIDGHEIEVRHLPLLDTGARALNSEKHPISGLPLESYRMFFLDMSTYDGESNIKLVSRQGREMLRWAVAGATTPRGFDGNNLRASDIDGASVHFLCEGGISIRRATNCLHLECTLS